MLNPHCTCACVNCQAHSGTSNGLWSDAGEHLVESVVCHGSTHGSGGPNFGHGSTVNYVTSITGARSLPRTEVAHDGALHDMLTILTCAICRVMQGALTSGRAMVQALSTLQPVIRFASTCSARATVLACRLANQGSPALRHSPATHPAVVSLASQRALTRRPAQAPVVATR